MKRRWLIIILSLITALCMAFSFAACGGKTADSGLGDVTQQGGNEQGGQQGGNQGGNEQGGQQGGDQGGNEQGGQQGGDQGGNEQGGQQGGEEHEDGTLDFELNQEQTGYFVSGLGSYSGSDVEIPDSYLEKPVLGISEGAFKGNTTLKSVIIGVTVTIVGDSAFEGCSGLLSVVIGINVTFIGDSAFAGCDHLTSVQFGENVTHIGSSAFEGCSGLTSIVIGINVTFIGENAFAGCSKLTKLEFDGSTDLWKQMQDLLEELIETLLEEVQCSDGTLQGEEIKHTHTYLNGTCTDCGYEHKDHEFEGYTRTETEHSQNCSVCGKTESAAHTYKNGSCSTCGYEHQNHTYAARVWQSDSSSHWQECETCGAQGDKTAHNFGSNGLCQTCNYERTPSVGLNFSLNADKKSYSVTGIGNCKDADLVIPSTYEEFPVTSIGSNAFKNQSELTSITIPSSVTSIGIYAFCGCSGLEEITIPGSVTSIGSYAFYECSGLTSVSIGNGVTSIGDLAFWNCSRLASTDIPSSVTSIGTWAFRNCSGLTSIDIPSSVTSIGDWAFLNCSGLAEIKVDKSNPIYHAEGNCLIETKSKILIAGCKTSQIPDDGSVTSIGSDAFCGCSGLTSIIIPSSVTSIGPQAFDECSGLTSVSIGNGVTSIGNYAFDGCISLTTIHFEGTTTQWKDIQKGSNWRSTYIKEVICANGTLTGDEIG